MFRAMSEADRMKSMRFHSPNCEIVIERPAARVVVVRVSGWDVGEFGEAPITEVETDLATPGKLRLFIDARDVKGASMEVSNAWARWLAAHRERFHSVHMATGSRFIRMTADFVRRYAELDGIMTVDENTGAFEAALRTAIEATGRA